MTNLTAQHLTARDMRRLALSAQGLLRPSFGRGREAALRAIRRLGYLQIDTISVVERAHHHALSTRVPGYSTKMLDQLHQSRDVFEYWAHAAAYLPIEDYRFYLPMMRGYSKTRELDRKLANRVKARIRAEGPLQSRDFESPAGHKSGGWWDWKPSKVALDQLFLRGELMITRRDGFQKVYDLTERVLPASIDVRHPTQDEWGHYFASKFTRALGAATKAHLAYASATIRRFGAGDIRPHIESALPALLEEGVVTEVSFRDQQWYVASDLLAQLPMRLGSKRIRFLSPFDNLVINRSRLQALFEFEYQIECYVPAPKRQFGYFCLPILWGDEIVGRMDAKANRKSDVLEVHGLFLESGRPADASLVEALSAGLKEFCQVNGCDRVVVKRTLPAALKTPLAASLAPSG